MRSGIFSISKQERRQWISAYLFLLPAAAFFLVFMYVPIMKALLLSFQEWSLTGTEWVGLDNYRIVLSDPEFYKALKITVIYVVLSVGLGLVVSIFIAMMIDPLTSKLQSFFKASFYLPSVAPIVIVSIVWSWLYNPSFGLLNYLLGEIGLPPVLWLGDPDLAIFSIVAMTLAVGQGPSILILSASLGGIPKDYYEAGRIDGTTGWSEMLHIKLPLLKPALLYLIVVNTVGSFQVFAPIYMLTSGGPNGATSTIGYLIYEKGFKTFAFSIASTQTVLLLIIVLVIAFIQFKWLSSDVEY